MQKLIFEVTNNDMSPYLTRGDSVTYELIKDLRLYNSVYVVILNNIKMVVRVQVLMRGGIRIIFDSDKTNFIQLDKEQLQNLIVIGHVTGRIKKSGEHIKGYSLYS